MSSHLTAKFLINFADEGYQFERFVTGGQFDDLHGTSMVEHIQLMDIGGYNILIAAECDAIDDDGNMIEMKATKASNQQFWGTRVLLQMISNGSSVLYFGEKNRSVDRTITELSALHKRSLLEVGQTALQNGAALVENNIMNCLKTLREYALAGRFGGDKVYEVSFDSEGNLALLPSRYEAGTVLLPPSLLVSEMLRTSAN